MMTAWKAYIVVGLAVGVAACIGFSYAKGYSNGKEAILAKLAADRVVILKDGVKVDEKVLAADDNELVCMLVDCVQPNDGD